jgi:hypothetical protein
MLINLGMYESMIAEALHTGIVLYLSGLGHRYRQSAQYVARGLARDHHGYGLADDHWRHHPPQFAVAIGSTIYGGRTSTIVAALIVGALGAFLSFKGYVPHA